MPLDHRHRFRFAIRFAVAQIDPHRNRQAQLRRHHFRIAIQQSPLSDTRAHQRRKIRKYIRIIHLRLNLRQCGVAKLFDRQQLAHLAVLRIVQNIANVPKNFLYRRIHRHIPARLGKRIRIRFLLYKNGMPLILLQCVLQQRVQHILFAGKVAV